MMHDLGLVLVTAGVTALIVWPYAVREGMQRAARLWRGRRDS